MKPISKTFFSLVVIFALLFNDVVITARARGREAAVFRLLNENERHSSSPNLEKKDVKNQNNETNDGNFRLKSERKNQIVAHRDKNNFNMKFLITLLILCAVGFLIVIGGAIGKSYLNSKREKEDEIFKKDVLTEKVQQQLEKEKQNELFLEYCQLFQTLGKLVETNILLGKFHVQELNDLKKETLDTNAQAVISKMDSIALQFTNEEKAFTRQNYENCYNAFHWRSPITDVGGISKDLTFTEADFLNVKDMLVTAKAQVKKAAESAHVTPSDYLELGDLVEQGTEAYSTLTEIHDKAKEKTLGDINKYNPINIETPANTFIGDAKLGGQIASGAWSLYKGIVELDEIKEKAEKDNLGWARKGLAYVTSGWEMLENTFKTSNTVVGMVGGTSLNIPFTGLVTITLKLVAAISNYKVAYDTWSADKTDLKELTKDLKFWDMMDAICDLIQELANDLIIIAPLTAGLSAGLGIALKVVFGLIGIFTAWMKLRKSRAIHEKIIVGLKKVTSEQEKNTKVMSEELTKKYCVKINEILRQYLDHEFKRFEQDLVYKRNLAEEQYNAEFEKQNPGLGSFKTFKAKWSNQIESANVQVLTNICANSHENCFKSFNALIENGIYPFARDGYRQYAQKMVEDSIIAVRSGPINSALVVLQGNDNTHNTQSLEFSLMTNGYVPAYQSSGYNIFVCRSCLDTSLVVESLTFGNTDDKYPVKDKAHIQDTIHIRNLANNVETVQFMNAILGDSDTTKEAHDYAIIHGASAPELKTFTKSTTFDFYSLVIYSGKTFPSSNTYPLLGAIATTNYFYLFGASSSSETDIRNQLCKSGSACSFHIVRVDEGPPSRIVENDHSLDVRVRTEAYDHSSHIHEKGYLYAFSTKSADNQLYINAGWEAINSVDISFESAKFRLYRKKIHDVSSILTREYDVDPKSIWDGMKNLEKTSSRSILALTKKVHCETCKTAFANTVYGFCIF